MIIVYVIVSIYSSYQHNFRRTPPRPIFEYAILFPTNTKHHIDSNGPIDHWFSVAIKFIWITISSYGHLLAHYRSLLVSFSLNLMSMYVIVCMLVYMMMMMLLMFVFVFITAGVWVKPVLQQHRGRCGGY